MFMLAWSLANPTTATCVFSIGNGSTLSFGKDGANRVRLKQAACMIYDGYACALRWGANGS